MKSPSATIVLAALGALASATAARAQGGWLRLSPPTSPPFRFEHAMAYDSARSRVVLFGGAGTLADTWEWDGTNWTQHISGSASLRPKPKAGGVGLA